MFAEAQHGLLPSSIVPVQEFHEMHMDAHTPLVSLLATIVAYYKSR